MGLGVRFLGRKGLPKRGFPQEESGCDGLRGSFDLVAPSNPEPYRVLGFRVWGLKPKPISLEILQPLYISFYLPFNPPPPPKKRERESETGIRNL